MLNSNFCQDIVIVEQLLHKILNECSYRSVERMGGLTNHTYKVSLDDGREYVFRIPGEGTEEMIRRDHERISTELACKLDVDTSLIYFGEDGTKITKYISGAETLTAETLGRSENIEKVAKVLRKLHTCGVDTGVPFDVFNMAEAYERIILNNHVALFDDYMHIKKKIMDIKARIDGNGKAACVPCHNDPLCENWVLGGDGQLYLIDWEYAGMNDGMWDLADVSIEAMFSKQQDLWMLRAYFDREPTQEEKAGFEANKLYLDFLWALWGKTRVPFEGEVMEQYAKNRYLRLKENLAAFG